jgi:hypothetical protein
MDCWKAAQLGHLKAESLVEQSGVMMAVRSEFWWVVQTARVRVGYLVGCSDAHLVVWMELPLVVCLEELKA